jgi:hypothetical protein
MEFLHSLIALILQTLGQGMKVNARGFEQLEVMLPPFAKEGTDHLLSVSVNHQLALQRVAFLFARIERPLATFGALNWGFGDIDDDHSWSAEAPHQLPFSG